MFEYLNMKYVKTKNLNLKKINTSFIHFYQHLNVGKFHLKSNILKELRKMCFCQRLSMAGKRRLINDSISGGKRVKVTYSVNAHYCHLFVFAEHKIRTNIQSLLQLVDQCLVDQLMHIRGHETVCVRVRIRHRPASGHGFER